MTMPAPGVSGYLFSTASSAPPCKRRSGGLALLGFAQPPRERLEKLPRDRGVVLEERSEVPGDDAETVDVGVGRDRRRSRARGDQCHVSEPVARTEMCNLATA